MPIYIICIDGDPPGSPVKIGHAKNAADRLGTLQTSHYRDYLFLRLMEGTPADEKRIHQQFQHLRIRGEWFDFDTEMMGDLGLADIPIPPRPLPMVRGAPMPEHVRKKIGEGVRRSYQMGSLGAARERFAAQKRDAAA